MAFSRFPTTQYSSDELVESAGAILFHQSTKRVCLLHFIPRGEYFFAKGRRNCGESRLAAALREVREETGYPCRALPVTMSTRAPPPPQDETTEQHSPPDLPRTYPHLTEPFTLQIRQLGGERNIKLIWWYIVVVNEDEPFPTEDRPGEEKENFQVALFSYEEALQKLTFQLDREILQKAIDLVEATYS